MKDNYIFILESQVRDLEEDIKDFGGGQLVKLVARKVKKNTNYLINRILDELESIKKQGDLISFLEVKKILEKMLKE